MKSQRTLTVVVPAYNEEDTIQAVLEQVLHVSLIDGMGKELIVVDDCSTDRTAALVEQYVAEHSEANIALVSHSKNQGKGAALRTGFARATGDFVIVQDADLEYDPEEYNLLLEPMLKERADVVYGSRFQGGKAHRIMFFWHSIGNRALTMMSNAFSNQNLSDMETCYKLFRREVIQQVQIEENRFGFEPEITAKVAQLPGVRVYEVGISYYGRTYAEGKKIGWRDGVRALYCIVKYNKESLGAKRIMQTMKRNLGVDS